MDDRSLRVLNTLHPKIRYKAIAAWNEAQAAMPANVQIIAINGLRTFQESDTLFAQGRTAPGSIVTNAKAGQSYHNYGLAFDFAMLTNGKDDTIVGPNWMKVVDIMKRDGFAWGGDFKLQGGSPDYPHFEMHFGINWRQLLEKYNAKDFIPGTNYVNI